MNYEFDTYIKNAQCVVLSSSDVLYAYQDTHNRRQYVRTGANWVHNASNYSNYGYDLSSYVCVDINNIEYEYKYISPIYNFISFVVVALAFYLAYHLIIGRLFKGGSKW